MIPPSCEVENYRNPFCDDVNKYETIAKIGQGTFGEVFKAKHRVTKQVVALKKVIIKDQSQGFPITAIREIKILQRLKHENVVNLIEICRRRSQNDNNKVTFYLVFDFCEHDLAGLLRNIEVKFSLAEIKKVMQQLLDGLFYIHSNKILHRDMKAANILITKNGVLKLADFGLARALATKGPNKYTNSNRVVTLWYRSPELLLGTRNYASPVDMWAAGCIMAELWTRIPILQGKSELHQLKLICELCGPLTPEEWPGIEKVEIYKRIELPSDQKRCVKERLKPCIKDPYALDLLDKLLCLDPKKRMDADAALNHDFFWSDPMPADLAKMLSQHTTSMFEFLPPPRQRGPVQPGHGNPASRVTANDGQYHDRVF